MKKKQIKIDQEIYDLVRDHYLALEQPTQEDLRVLRWMADKEWRMYKHDDYLADKERRTRGFDFTTVSVKGCKQVI